MTKYSLIFLLLLLSISSSAANHQQRPLIPSPPPHHHRSLPTPPPPLLLPPPTPPPPLNQHQLNNIINALIGAGDFNNWANMLSASTLFMLPLSATLFVPSDHSLFPVQIPTSSTAAGFDPFVVPYHIVPQRLTFSELTLFKPFSRLPTLLPSRSILITNTCLSNFTLDASQVSHPDLYLTPAIAVHGIAALLNYTVYGGDNGIGLPAPPPPMFNPLGEVMVDGRRSDAGCLYGEFAFVLLLIPWVVCGFKIYGNPLMYALL